MAINLEARLAKIENELKALKVAYNAAGSLAKMYVQTSEEEDVGGSTSAHTIKIKFTPKYGMGRNNIITMFPITTDTYLDVPLRHLPTYTIAPQDESGEIIMTVYGVTSYEKIQVIASGTSPGTFSRIT